MLLSVVAISADMKVVLAADDAEADEDINVCGANENEEMRVEGEVDVYLIDTGKAVVVNVGAVRAHFVEAIMDVNDEIVGDTAKDDVKTGANRGLVVIELEDFKARVDATGMRTEDIEGDVVTTVQQESDEPEDEIRRGESAKGGVSSSLPRQLRDVDVVIVNTSAESDAIEVSKGTPRSNFSAEASEVSLVSTRLTRFGRTLSRETFSSAKAEVLELLVSTDAAAFLRVRRAMGPASGFILNLFLGRSREESFAIDLPADLCILGFKRVAKRLRSFCFFVCFCSGTFSSLLEVKAFVSHSRPSAMKTPHPCMSTHSSDSFTFINSNKRPQHALVLGCLKLTSLRNCATGKTVGTDGRSQTILHPRQCSLSGRSQIP